MKQDEIETYIDSIEYLTPYYEELSDKLKKISDKSQTMKFICHD
jgi:hypothetical protein